MKNELISKKRRFWKNTRFLLLLKKTEKIAYFCKIRGYFEKLGKNRVSSKFWRILRKMKNRILRKSWKIGKVGVLGKLGYWLKCDSKRKNRIFWKIAFLRILGKLKGFTCCEICKRENRWLEQIFDDAIFSILRKSYIFESSRIFRFWKMAKIPCKPIKFLLKFQGPGENLDEKPINRRFSSKLPFWAILAIFHVRLVMEQLIY